MKKSFYSVKELASELGVTRQWISKQCKFKHIKSEKAGRDYIILSREAEKWINKIKNGVKFDKCAVEK